VKFGTQSANKNIVRNEPLKDRNNIKGYENELLKGTVAPV
jgi:hypothetical protein